MASHNGGNKTPEQPARIAEREDWFKLVVKIINWKDGNPENRAIVTGKQIGRAHV